MAADSGAIAAVIAGAVEIAVLVVRHGAVLAVRHGAVVAVRHGAVAEEAASIRRNSSPEWTPMATVRSIRRRPRDPRGLCWIGWRGAIRRSISANRFRSL